MRVRTIAIAVATLVLAACGSSSDMPAEPAIAPSGQSEELALGVRPASFAQCATCHAVQSGKNGIGPSLAGVFDAKAAHIGDFAYSSAMRQSGLIWDTETLDRYLENPRKTVLGTKMSYAGMRDAEERARIVEYLKTL